MLPPKKTGGGPVDGDQHAAATGDRRAATTSNRRAVRLLAAGGLVSSFGDGAAITALTFIVYQRTHSAMLLSVAYLVSFGVVGFFTPLAGWLADRVDRRRLIIACELASAALFLAVTFVSAPWLMIALVFAASLAGAPVWPAFEAAIPNLVTPDDLTWANSLGSVTFNIGRTAGPVAGGFLIAIIGGGGVFALNAATFTVLAGFVWLATGDYSAKGDHTSPEAHGLWAGFRHVAHSRFLLPIVIAWTIMWLAVDIAWVADAPLAEELHVGAVGFGLLGSLFGLGAILGGLAARWLRRRGEPAALLSGTFGVTVGFAFVGLAPQFALVLFGEMIAAFLDSFGAVAGTNVLQRSTPDAIRGRVFGAIGAAGLIMNVPAFLLGGVLVGAIGPRGVYLVGAAIAVVAGLVMLPGLRSLRAERATAVATEAQGDAE
jgi:MFS family permease